MRVAFDATSLIGQRTGIGNCTAHLLEGLPRPGLDIVAFAVSARGGRQLRAALPPAVSHISRPMAARPLRAMWRRTDHPRIERWTGRVDVVHGPNFVVPPSRGGAEIVTVHDLTCIRYPQLCTSDTLQIPTLLARAVARGAWVHAVSRFVADEVIENFALPAERVVVIPNGTSAMVDPGEVPALRARGHAIVGAEHYLLSLGTLEPRKDIPSLIAAFDLIAASDPDLLLVIAGPDGWGASQVTDAISRSPFRNRISRTGWLDDRERDAVIAGASVFVYPSLYEGFGLPPLEAIALGTPVVATRVGALAEVLRDGAEWAEPKDPESLATAITRLLDDQAHCQTLLDAGEQRVKFFDWAKSSDALAALYGVAANSR